MTKLDIIVPHYKEPWNVGKKFFEMLSFQRQVDFKDFRVILVHDGKENGFPDEYFSGYPYEVEQISIEHAGVSTARNTGLKAAKADWVMFCDFDDMFVHVFALKAILGLLPDKDHDALFGDYIWERKLGNGRLVVATETEFNAVLVHAKVYRRKFILKHNLWFNPELNYCEDSEFNTILFMLIKPERIGKIITPVPFYAWLHREGSLSNSQVSRIKMEPRAKVCVYKRNKNVCEACKKYASPEHYCMAVTRAIWDTYYFLNTDDHDEQLEWVRKDFAKWYMENEDVYLQIGSDKFPKIQRAAMNDNKRTDFREDITFDKWIEDLLNNYSE